MNDTERAIRAYLDAFNAHDLEGLLATLSDDVEHEINEGGTEVGREAFRKFKTHMDTCYREQITDLVVFSNGTRGAVEFTCSGTYLSTDGSLPPASGQTYSIPAAAFLRSKMASSPGSPVITTCAVGWRRSAPNSDAAKPAT